MMVFPDIKRIGTMSQKEYNALTLQEVLDLGIELTDDSIDQLVKLLTYRCRLKKTRRVRSVIAYSFHSFFPTLPAWAKGGLRLYQYKDGTTKWAYFAGQCYDSDIKALRELIAA